MPDDRGRAQEFVIVDRGDVAEVLALAAKNGVEVEEIPSRGIEPVTTVTLLLLGAATAVATVAYLVDQSKGGQVIDLRDKAPRIAYRTREVTYGLVLIVAKDGTVTVEVKEPRGMFGQVTDALKGLGVELGKAGIAAVAEAAKKAVGNAGTVSSKPSPA